MMKLMQKLLKARVRPYYIYMADQVAGGEHFRTTVEKGLEIIKALRGWTSGLAVPHFVIDAPGGGGKVPLLPEYVEEINDDEVIFRNYEGKRFVYKQPKPADVPDVAPGIAAERGTSCRSKRARRRRRSASARDGSRRTADVRRADSRDGLTGSATPDCQLVDPRQTTGWQRLPLARVHCQTLSQLPLDLGERLGA